jgi:hypothetical protein
VGIVSPAALLLATVIAQVEMRDLAGSYCVQEVTERRTTVELSFATKVVNVTGEAIGVRRFWLANAANTDVPYAAFEGGTFEPGEARTLSSWIEVPLAEYGRWQKQGAPRLFLEVDEPATPPLRVPQRITLQRATDCRAILTAEP